VACEQATAKAPAAIFAGMRADYGRQLSAVPEKHADGFRHHDGFMLPGDFCLDCAGTGTREELIWLGEK